MTSRSQLRASDLTRCENWILTEDRTPQPSHAREQHRVVWPCLANQPQKPNTEIRLPICVLEMTVSFDDLTLLVA